MVFFADDFGRSLAEERLAEEGFAGGFNGSGFVGGQDGGETAEENDSREMKAIQTHLPTFLMPALREGIVRSVEQEMSAHGVSGLLFHSFLGYSG